jgi:hypothetical protein
VILPLPGASGVSTGELSRRIVYTVRRGGNPARKKEKTMWYVLPYDKPIAEMLAQYPGAFPTYLSATEKAETLHDMTGQHYRVVRIEAVWSTKTASYFHEERKTA